MLCADVAPADGASIQQNLKQLEEKLQSVGSSFSTKNNRTLVLMIYVYLCCNPPSPLGAEAGLASLRQKGGLLLEQMCSQPSWSLEETEGPAGEQQDNVQHIQAVMEEMQLRKQRYLFF